MEKKIQAKLAEVKAELATVQTEIATEKQAAREESASILHKALDEIRLEHERDVLELLLKVDTVSRGVPR